MQNFSKFVAYVRVSTLKQDYGLDAQLSVIDKWIKNRGELIATFEEKVSGKIDQRPQLAQAIALCKKENAILLISKLDRLSRNVQFLFQLKESGINIACCELPELNTLTLGIFATIAQHERELISMRTKAGLEVARNKGKIIGRKKGEVKELPFEAAKAAKREFALERNKASINAVRHFKEKGITNSQMARELNFLGFTAPKGGKLSSKQISRLMKYL